MFKKISCNPPTEMKLVLEHYKNTYPAQLNVPDNTSFFASGSRTPASYIEADENTFKKICRRRH